MSTPARAPAPDRVGARLWWLVPEATAAIALLVLLASGVGAGPREVTAVAAERAARMLEQVSPAEHHDHGHEVGAEDQIYCGVDVFGLDPPSARAIAEVRTVYGYYFCAVGRSGVPYLESSRSDGPIVVQLADPPAVQIAAPGEDYQARVRAMMPDEYEALCFGGLPDPSVADEVKRRYESEV